MARGKDTILRKVELAAFWGHHSWEDIGKPAAVGGPTAECFGMSGWGNSAVDQAGYCTDWKRDRLRLGELVERSDRRKMLESRKTPVRVCILYRRGHNLQELRS